MFSTNVSVLSSSIISSNVSKLLKLKVKNYYYFLKIHLHLQVQPTLANLVLLKHLHLCIMEFHKVLVMFLLLC